jgi:fluoride exporter
VPVVTADLPGSGEDDVVAPTTRHRHPLTGQGRAIAAVAAGGVLGALGRHGLGLALPHPPGGFPAATFAVNVLGCLLLGALVVTLTEPRPAHPLLRPFLATGVLGGFTTFSAYATDAHELVTAGRVPAALGYLAGTLVAALLATAAGVALARRLLRHRLRAAT